MAKMVQRVEKGANQDQQKAPRNRVCEFGRSQASNLAK